MLVKLNMHFPYSAALFFLCSKIISNLRNENCLINSLKENKCFKLNIRIYILPERIEGSCDHIVNTGSSLWKVDNLV